MELTSITSFNSTNTQTILNTVKPVLSGHHIKRTPSIERTSDFFIFELQSMFKVL